MRLPLPADVGLAALLAVTGLLELALVDIEVVRPWLTAALGLVAAGAMLLRTLWPLACLAITVGLVVVAHVPGTGLALTGALVVGCLIALGSVGRHCSDHVSLAAAAGTIVLFVVGAAFASRPWDVVIAVLACGAAWGAGRLLRREAQRNVQLTSLAADLVAEREARAREAVQSERIRIARELHDAVAHTVSVMTLQVGGVRRRLDTDSGRSHERDVLRDVEALGRQVVGELHQVLGVLRTPGADSTPPSVAASDPVLAPQPRLAQVHELADRVRAAGVPVDLRVEGSPEPLPAGLELAAYRVVQEGLTNILKHGRHGRARVTITYAGTEIRLAVQDDAAAPAHAVDASDDSRHGLGLIGMRERVALYGGHLEAGPMPGRGFAVRATLPVPSESAP